MGGKILARLGAIIFVAIAITAMVIEMTRDDEPVQTRSAPSLQPTADPLRQSLRHCQQLGEAAVNDPGCLATWAENRDRFLGRTPVPAAPHQNGGE
ncbi:putative entry exclusion protein TrbK-alt [Ochrobactrum sp. RH2CCR150]|uniref:putative entry exclusion protein TrbK-alt n=1 Tax=Ochrobactrum sp. RH2CCR150 TaxID=2587044 RepID=UPI0015F8F8C2|nr:conjugative transfer region protein TrbK [Ochrobactrum sp. RH2CCR150]